MAIRLSFHILVVLQLPTLLACGGGGAGGSSDNPGSGPLSVTGLVRSPGGQSIGLGLERPRFEHTPRSSIKLPGLLTVPNFTDVELVRVDPLGNELSIVAQSVTVNGRFTFDLDTLNLDFSSQLLVRAGTESASMRTPVTAPEVDIDPLNEAVMRLFLQDGGRLDHLTFKEIDDIRATVEFLALREGLAAGADVPSTVDLVYQAVLAEPMIVEYVARASTAGQTDEGPGDFANFFPMELGDTWALRGARSVDGGDPQAHDTARRILFEENGDTTFGVFTPPDSRAPELERMEKSSTALIDHGFDDEDDPLRAFYPLEAIRFPIRLGESRTLLEEMSIPAGRDFDADGTEDSMDVVVTQSVVALEDVLTTIGSFPGCLRLERRVEASLALSGGGAGLSENVRTRWYAPELGLLRERSEILTEIGAETRRETVNQALHDFVRGTEGVGILPLVTLNTGLPEPTSPGRPGPAAVGFDGARHLVVTCREESGSSLLQGTLVGHKGLPELVFPIHPLTDPECRPDTAIAFGDSYLIVFVQHQENSSRIRGVRVTSGGDVLDPGGFDISNGPADTRPAVAYEGDKFAVVWRRETAGEDEGDLHATFVTSLGGALPEFPLQTGPGDARDPTIAFGTDSYICTWSDTAGGKPELRATRFDTLGSVQGDPAFAIANADASQGDIEPRIAFDGQAFLVAWLRIPSGSPDVRHLLGVRLNTQGVVADIDAIQIRTAAFERSSLTMDHDGEHFACVWRTHSEGDAAGIHLARVSREGFLQDGSSLGPPRSLVRVPEDAAVSRPALGGAGLTGGSGALVIWYYTKEGATNLEARRAFSF